MRKVGREEVTVARIFAARVRAQRRPVLRVQDPIALNFAISETFRPVPPTSRSRRRSVRFLRRRSVRFLPQVVVESVSAPVVDPVDVVPVVSVSESPVVSPVVSPLVPVDPRVSVSVSVSTAPEVSDGTRHHPASQLASASQQLSASAHHRFAEPVGTQASRHTNASGGGGPGSPTSIGATQYPSAHGHAGSPVVVTVPVELVSVDVPDVLSGGGGGCPAVAPPPSSAAHAIGPASSTRSAMNRPRTGVTSPTHRRRPSCGH
jgi:hypothetical protein